MAIPDAARQFTAAGCSVVPARNDGSKAPAGTWKQHQHRHATDSELTSWFTNQQYCGFGIVCGAISGNLEMLEFEGRAVAEGKLTAFSELAAASGLGPLWENITAGYTEHTPSGGLHILYRVSGTPVPGNTKLARRPATAEELAADPDDKIKVLIETRGEGGFVIVAPSNGTTHPSGRSWVLLRGGPHSIPTITADQHHALHTLAAAFDQLPMQAAADPIWHEPLSQPRTADSGHPSPGDDYNQRTEWAQILTDWTQVYRNGSTTYWRRPGKTIGISATTGRNDGDNLYVFSTSTGFEAEKPYSKFATYSFTHHSGDFTAAAKALLRAGYGSGRQQRPSAPAGASPPTAPSSPTAPMLPDEFWNATAALTHIRQAARAKIVGPDALFGAVLARLSLLTHHELVLPKLPRAGSLNIIVALAGESGDGKGACLDLAADLLPAPPEPCACGNSDHANNYLVAPPGSGEGLVRNFFDVVEEEVEGRDCKKRRESKLKMDRNNVLIRIDEGEVLGHLGARQGQTTMTILRQAWSGEELGFSYANKEKRLRIAAHGYRMSVVLGIQPTLAAAVFADVAGGTPQRFIWLGLADPQLPDMAPEDPGPLHDVRLEGNPWMNCIVVDDAIVAELTAKRRKRLSGHLIIDPLDSHRDLSRLKVAALLSRLDLRTNITAEDWRLAGIVMDTSGKVRDWVRGCVADDISRRQGAANAANAERAAVAQLRVSGVDVRIAAATKRMVHHVTEHSAKTGEPCAWRCIAQNLGSKYDRDEKDTARDALIASGLVVEIVSDDGALHFSPAKDSK